MKQWPKDPKCYTHGRILFALQQRYEAQKETFLPFGYEDCGLDLKVLSGSIIQQLDIFEPSKHELKKLIPMRPQDSNDEALPIRAWIERLNEDRGIHMLDGRLRRLPDSKTHPAAVYEEDFYENIQDGDHGLFAGKPVDFERIREISRTRLKDACLGFFDIFRVVTEYDTMRIIWAAEIISDLVEFTFRKTTLLDCSKKALGIDRKCAGRVIDRMLKEEVGYLQVMGSKDSGNLNLGSRWLYERPYLDLLGRRYPNLKNAITEKKLKPIVSKTETLASEA